MGLFKKSNLGARYDLLDYEVRTWCMDRTDYWFENPNDNAVISASCNCGRNHDNSNPNFIFEICENREWNPSLRNWQPDGRFSIDIVWPWNSDKKSNSKSNFSLDPLPAQEKYECPVEPEDLKKLADFIYDFLQDHGGWGAKSSTKTKSENSLFEQYNFNCKYQFNYFIYDTEKNKEIVNFDFAIKKYKFGTEGFEAFAVCVDVLQESKKIDQIIETIMTPVQLKDFADFIYDSLGEDIIKRLGKKK